MIIGPSAYIFYMAIQSGPELESDLLGWIKNQYLQNVSASKGYKKSTLYELKYARTNRDDREGKVAPPRPKFLVLHEFDSRPERADISPTGRVKLPSQILPSAWVEDGTYRLQGKFGDETVPL
jgi:hypothetical protein